MSYNSIRISRERGGFQVRCTDPAIEAENRNRDHDSKSVAPYRDPDVEYNFDTKDETIAFITNAIDLALPAETFTSAFDKFAKEAQGKS